MSTNDPKRTYDRATVADYRRTGSRSTYPNNTNAAAPRLQPGQLLRPIPARNVRHQRFERFRTVADITTKRVHDRRSKDRISHADRSTNSGTRLGKRWTPPLYRTSG